MSIRDFPYIVNTEAWRVDGSGPWGGWPQLDGWLADNLRHFLFPLEAIVGGRVEYAYCGGVYPAPCSGIYFLMAEGVIVYVGQSVNIGTRLSAHFLDPGKEFTHYWCIQGVPHEILDDVEQMYLSWLRPKGNARFRGCSDVAKGLIAGLERQA